jgi:hypothetical protein
MIVPTTKQKQTEHAAHHAIGSTTQSLLNFLNLRLLSSI